MNSLTKQQLHEEQKIQHRQNNSKLYRESGKTDKTIDNLSTYIPNRLLFFHAGGVKIALSDQNITS
jgi:hypothetical protein